jgi:gluconolactonase
MADASLASWQVDLEPIARGGGFVEGPVIWPAGALSVTSVDRGVVYRVRDGEFELLAATGGGANGSTIDAEGNIYVTQNGRRFAPEGPRWGPDSVGGVQVIDRDGDVRWLTRDPISPNDLCFGPDGLLYMTDPTRDPVRSEGRIWRVDPKSGETELLGSVPWFTNGIGFDAEDVLWVAATRESRLMAFDVEQGQLVDERIALEMGGLWPDGFAFDVEGNVIVAAVGPEEGDQGEIQVWSARGELLAALRPSPSRHFTNVALSPDRLLIVTDADTGNVFAAADFPTAGLLLHPFRS